MYKLYTGKCVRILKNEQEAKHWLSPLGDGIVTNENDEFITIKIKGLDNILRDTDKMKLYKNEINEIMNNNKIVEQW